MTSPPPYHRPVEPPPQRRGSSGRPWVIWVIVGVAAVSLLCPVTGFLLWMFAGPDLDEPRAAVESYLVRVESGDDAAAYASLCASTRSTATAAQFTEVVLRSTRPVSHRITRVTFSNEAGTQASVTVELTNQAGTVRSVRLTADDEDGAWQVCGYPVI